MFPGISTQIFLKERLEGKHAVALRDAGFEAAEIYCFPPHFDCRDKAHVREAARAFRDEGFTISALHAPFLEHESGESRRLSISHPAENMRNRALVQIEQCIEAAVETGARAVVIHFGSTRDKDSRILLSLLFSSMVRIEDMLRGTGVSAAYENIATPASLVGYVLHIIEKYEFRNAGVCLDIGHANINEDPAVAIERCGPLLINVHASDNSGHEDTHDIPFLGNVKWGLVVRTLKQIGYNGPFTLETRFKGDPYIMLPHLRSAYDSVILAADENTTSAPGETGDPNSV